MTMEKRFFDVFIKYNPTPEKKELLMRGENAQFRYSKEPMRVEVELTFNQHEDALLIYEIEDECREFYGAESFKIFPHFPPSTFKIENFEEITTEAALCGAVTHGFFNNATYTDDGNVITANIPFTIYGIDFVKSANTEKILSNILLSRYGINRKVVIRSAEGAENNAREWEARRAKMLVDMERENQERYIRERDAADMILIDKVSITTAVPSIATVSEKNPSSPAN